jgi:spore cortex formation protein SpoVR/YcgB (stage V sporulation)
LYEDSEWSFEKIEKTWEVIDDIGKNVFGIDYFPPQLEMVSYEQMLDNYSSTGMPNMYRHWSFGKRFIEDYDSYIAGKSGLAYEMIINTNPSIAYLMENNSMTMQALVMAHAVCGHASFFKNNYLFKEWTDAESILDYLAFAKQYVEDCEYKYGAEEVEQILDACHSLKYYGIDKYKRRGKIKQSEIDKRKEDWVKYLMENMSSDWDIDYVKKEIQEVDDVIHRLKQDPRTFPEENILYFIEKYSPVLEEWQKELVRIVRKISQYFYPQMQTQLMNEGWATFVDHHIMTHMHEEGYINDGAYLEFLKDHTNVVYQPTYKQSAGFNPYALGFAMFKDIERICKSPTEEDKYWFPDIAGEKDWMGLCKEIVELYRDESFVLKYLSPKVIRDFKMFVVHDDENMEYYQIDHVQDDDDILAIREKLSKQYSITERMPQIDVVDVDWDDTRRLVLRQFVRNGRLLDHNSASDVTAYIESLWGYPVEWTVIEET